MVKLEEIEQKLNECQKALAELKESKKEGKWKPAMSENYWFRNDYGDVDFCQWCDTDIDIITYQHSQHNPSAKDIGTSWIQ